MFGPRQMIPFPDDLLYEDSKDLTDEEVAGATPVDSSKPIEASVQESCPLCGEPYIKVSFSLRRRDPYLYSRLTATCTDGHLTHKLFRIDYLVGLI